jgi:hypothetical protein
VNLATLYRFLEMALYLGIMIGARRFVFHPARRGV